MVDSEKLVEHTLVEATKEAGGMCLKLLTDYVTGLPDRMVLLPGGRMFFVELKTTGKKPRKIQLYMHEALRNLGFEVYVIDKIEEARKLIETKKKL
jgi:hypothetical protein